VNEAPARNGGALLDMTACEFYLTVIRFGVIVRIGQRRRFGWAAE
jgi:hypothetical protein